eukprot:CAMPEP_0197901406 /NCGR_PEP_ID=MMETSP1439-20131203/50992_1 /TAXON_ID=66791 /ORGANISM="Gonyaulax spinifera, Strain CCMP409" /LENGTH=105 /DNA_ID=CAMNT_0043522373 /DNA_START=45 /DNA_END=359 /DNA_ORIENTATION=+
MSCSDQAKDEAKKFEGGIASADSFEALSRLYACIHEAALERGRRLEADRAKLEEHSRSLHLAASSRARKSESPIASTRAATTGEAEATASLAASALSAFSSSSSK